MPTSDPKIAAVLPGALFGECDTVYQHMRREGVEFDVVDDFSNMADSPV
jgi:hypothetical protein